ncbi:hypothetical protein [Chromatium okenii]|uniref:hypothetical protein n=1 Tax=Chromatium okenii TaxID=61644 RepID=UPI001558BFEE|nr:hypothetical protein [Chromatium okenii]
MNRAAATLPSLPLWLAAMIALATEAALVTGLAQLPSLQVVAPPQIPIEISFVAAPALTESAAVEAVSGISSAPQIPPTPLFQRGEMRWFLFQRGEMRLLLRQRRCPFQFQN